jgi:hypothetical protein
MGGYGSGRTGGRPTAEACDSYVFNASWFNRGRLKSGSHGIAPLRYSDGFEVSIVIDTRDQHYGFLTLSHARRNGDGSDVRYQVQLVQTLPNYGGVRWWFVCPRSGRRVAKLYLPLGGAYFWSRKAYGLGYRSQRESPLDRAHLAGQKLSKKLGNWEFWPDGPPCKPRWMRWRTYERLVARWEEIEARLDAAWLPRAARLLERLDRQSS